MLAKKVSSSFADIVTLLMRSETERNRTLADLEWMVVPAMQTGQFAVAEVQSQETGPWRPWGSCSGPWFRKTCDKGLRPKRPADEASARRMKSGDIPWIVAAFGENSVVGQLFEQLSKNVFTKQPAKLRLGTRTGGPSLAGWN